MKETIFYRQAELLLRILPVINREPDFALKGGTAINFFFRDLPRLSVDVDLTYLPITDRAHSLSEITSSLFRISDAINRGFPGVKVTPKKAEADTISALIVNYQGVTIKIEANLVIRGTVYPTETRRLSGRAKQLFKLAVSSRTLSRPDLYGGKLCAALDRQLWTSFWIRGII